MTLYDLKAGDKVISRTSSNTIPSILTVERVTKTRIHTSDGIVFNKKRGEKIGVTSWFRQYIFPATEEALKEIQEEEKRWSLVAVIIRECERHKLLEMDLTKLEALVQILTEVKHET